QGGRLVAQGSVQQLRGGTELMVRAAPLRRAQVILQQALGRGRVRAQDGALFLRVDPTRAPDVSRTLVISGCDLIELRPSERSLEDVFLQMTGEESGP
ncbi:MAG: ABC transporter ATP-binding protein, partial [Candidatus Dormibacteraeota bacterium]|nr:ABC transporter ATP-binding protein [Candidatus Dormibacteraeota bacterium]